MEDVNFRIFLASPLPDDAVVPCVTYPCDKGLLCLLQDGVCISAELGCSTYFATDTLVSFERCPICYLSSRRRRMLRTIGGLEKSVNHSFDCNWCEDRYHVLLRRQDLDAAASSAELAMAGTCVPDCLLQG